MGKPDVWNSKATNDLTCLSCQHNRRDKKCALGYGDNWPYPCVRFVYLPGSGEYEDLED
jgi:hypothetical protein